MLKWLIQENGDMHTFVEIESVQCRVGYSQATRILAIAILGIVPTSNQYASLLQLNTPLSLRQINLSLEEKKIVLLRREVSSVDEALPDLLDAAKRCVALLLEEE